MINCELALRSLDALEAFMLVQEQYAAARLEAMIKRRPVSFTESEFQANVNLVLERDRRFLRMARVALRQCDKKSLEDLIEEMRGLGHYFCSYCSDQNKLAEITSELYLNVSQILQSLD
jgi:hypothetical protein